MERSAGGGAVLLNSVSSVGPLIPLRMARTSVRSLCSMIPDRRVVVQMSGRSLIVGRGGCASWRSNRI